jgi:hypothetical protein
LLPDQRIEPADATDGIADAVEKTPGRRVSRARTNLQRQPPMTEHDAVVEAAGRLAAAIGRRDLGTIRDLLAPGFVHRTIGGGRVDSETFIQAIERIPGQIRLVRLEQIEVDLAPTGALVTGVQHAQVLMNGEVVDDRRAFVDWFVKHRGAWRIQAAVDLPGPGPS